MTQQELLQAVAIVSVNHSTEIAINVPQRNFVGTLGETHFNLYIKRCCASVINRLTEAGYSLSLAENGLSVEKY